MNKIAFGIGVVFMIGGGYVCFVGLSQTPVDKLVTVAGILVAVLGGIAVPHSPLGAALQTVIVNVGPYVPKIGGSRAGDPPAPPPNP